MENECLISVIVPAYNAENWLKRCIDSILNQTYRRLEIIIIDDGSTDNTPQMVDEYATLDSRIKVYHQENKGLVAVREKGIELATGQYVGFVDADDSIEPDMYQRLLDNAKKYEAEISQCGILYCFEDGRRKPMHGTGKIKIYDTVEGQKALLDGESFEPSLCNKLYAATIMKDSCLDTGVVNNEDLLRNFVLFQRANRSVYEDFCGYRYWRRNESMSNNGFQVRTWKNVLQAREVIVENAEQNMKTYALNCWLSALIAAYNSVFSLKDSESIAFGKQCRKALRENVTLLRNLETRKSLIGYMIIYFPWGHAALCSIHGVYTHHKIRKAAKAVLEK